MTVSTGPTVRSDNFRLEASAFSLSTMPAFFQFSWTNRADWAEHFYEQKRRKRRKKGKTKRGRESMIKVRQNKAKIERVSDEEKWNKTEAEAKRDT